MKKKEINLTIISISPIYQRIRTFDKEKSKMERIKDDGRWVNVEKIVLDKEILSQIPLEDRLVYVSEENSQFRLYHESIIDMIKSVNPVGMRFVPVEEWNSGILFDDMR